MGSRGSRPSRDCCIAKKNGSSRRRSSSSSSREDAHIPSYSIRLRDPLQVPRHSETLMIFPINSETSIFISGHAGGPTFIDFVFALNDFALRSNVRSKSKEEIIRLFCMAIRALGSELLPPSVGSIDKLERPASF